MRDKQFYINSVKMDLLRVVTAAGDVTRELPKQSITEFLEHANKDFEKTELDSREMALKQILKQLTGILPTISTKQSRLKWAEDVLTLRCRL